MPQTIYCPKCEAPNDETRPTCSNCGHKLKSEVTHTLSLKELNERQMHLTYKLQVVREITGALDRSGNVIPKVMETIERYRAEVVGEMRMVNEQRREAAVDARYPLQDAEPFDKDEFVASLRQSLRGWRQNQRLRKEGAYRDGYVDGFIEAVAIALDMDNDSVREFLSRHLPPSTPEPPW